MTNKGIRILFIEDQEDDVFLMVRELRRNGYDPVFERVQTAEEVLHSIKSKFWDIVISDYSLPGFNGLAALELLKLNKLETPFILVSGAIGEEVAVQAMKLGASDYIMKDNLTRLIPTLEREIRDSELRKSKKFTEIALRENEERFRALIENATDVTAIISKECFIKYLSPAIYKMTGYTSDEVMGSSIQDYLQPDDFTEFKSKIEECYIGGLDKSVLTVVKLKSKTGKILTLECSIKNATYISTIKGFIVNLRDITESTDLKKQVAISNRFIAIGELAAGIAHEINNPLMILQGNIDLIYEKLKDSGVLKEYADYLKAEYFAVERITKIVDTIRNYAPVKYEKESIEYFETNIENVFNDSLLFFTSSFENLKIKVEIENEAKKLSIKFNPSKLHQIFLILLSNAKDALENKKTKVIKVKFININDSLAMSFTDSGIGISKENLQKLFMPFYTTKDPGKGTGLGLSTMASILTEFNSRVEVSSELDIGTTFTLTFPLAKS